jgi:UDP-N-acetylglucosamine 2-epimerase (non-hydrolysing)
MSQFSQDGCPNRHMDEKKYLLVIGTRPEAIKMWPVLRALETDPQANCVVCVTGQHEELVKPFLSLFNIQPHYNLHVMSRDPSLCGLTAILLQEIGRVITLERPDWVLVQGDTTSAMAACLAACYGKVRVAHIEAGLRSHNKTEPFPEEINRRIIDQIADLHFAPTTLDKYDLIREGFSASSIHVTGNTSIDSLRYISDMPFSIRDSVLEELPFGSKRIVLVTVHRRENHGRPLENICAAIRLLADRYRANAHFVLPVHPNPNVTPLICERLAGIENVTLTQPLTYPELIALATASYFVMTDSGGLQEELPWLGKPSLVLRNVTDRREGVLAGASKLLGIKTGDIVAAAIELMENPTLYQQMAQPKNLFGDGMAGPRIAKILQSYDPMQANVGTAGNTTGAHCSHMVKPVAAIPDADLLGDTESTFAGLDNKTL